MRRVVVIVVAVVGLGGCSSGAAPVTSQTVTSGVVPAATSTIVAATPSTTFVASLSTVPGQPGPLFPDQAVLPVMVYVNGVVYDLTEVPARMEFDIGQSGLPYAGPPVVTEHGILVATGESYEATLTLYPAGDGDPLVLAHGVGRFAVAADGRRLAWAEPFKGPDGDAAETTRLVEVELPSGEVLHSATFLGFPIEGIPTWGFADVVAYVGDTHQNGNVYGNRVVLAPGGSCGIIATISADGSVTPPDANLVTDVLDCYATLSPTFSPDGALIAAAGSDGEAGPPILLLVSGDGQELARIVIDDVAGHYFQPHGIHWLDNETLVLLAASFDEGRTEHRDEQWGIYQCDTGPLECDLEQPISFNPTGWYQLALVTAP